MVSVMSYCIVFPIFFLFFSLGFDGSLKELPYLDFLKHLAGPPVYCWSAVEPPQGPTVGSPEPVEDLEELSPEKTIQRVKELVTASSDTLYKVLTVYIVYYYCYRDVLT